jgi:hypothetical protein
MGAKSEAPDLERGLPFRVIRQHQSAAQGTASFGLLLGKSNVIVGYSRSLLRGPLGCRDRPLRKTVSAITARF